MQTLDIYENDVICYTKHALKKMPIRSSAMRWRMVKENLPLSEREEIKHYVQDLVAPEDRRIAKSL